MKHLITDTPRRLDDKKEEDKPNKNNTGANVPKPDERNCHCILISHTVNTSLLLEVWNIILETILSLSLKIS